MKPGEYILRTEEIMCNEGTEIRIVNVTNRGDRPIQVGSHYHFAEVNNALEFDREAGWGFRLDIPAGTAVRFEPGDARSVHLVELAGSREVYGLQDRVNGSLGKIAPMLETEAIGGTAGIDATAHPEIAAVYDIDLPNSGEPAKGFHTDFGLDPVDESVNPKEKVLAKEAVRSAEKAEHVSGDGASEDGTR